MDPQTAEKLMTSSKDIQAFIAFIGMEMDKFNQTQDIDDGLSAEDLKIELKSRRLAYQKIRDIIDPFINIDTRSTNFNKNEYIA